MLNSHTIAELIYCKIESPDAHRLL